MLSGVVARPWPRASRWRCSAATAPARRRCSTRIIGVTRRFGGTIALGRRATSPGCAPEHRALAGIGWVPQERNIFRSLTVEENLTAVARPGPWTPARVYALFPRLKERRAQPRQPAFGRRAADAGDRPRAGAQPEAAAARRADRGPGADHRRGTAGGARSASCARRACRRSWSSRRPGRSWPSPTEAMILERGAHRPCRAPAPPCWPTSAALDTPSRRRRRSGPHA